MLGHIGGKWLDRLLQQLSKELRAIGWTQMQIATATGSTQSTVSRQIMKPVETVQNSKAIKPRWPGRSIALNQGNAPTPPA